MANTSPNRPEATKRLISSRFAYDGEQQRSALALPSTDRRSSFIKAVKQKLEGGEYQLESSDCPCGAVQDRDVVIAEVDRYGLPLRSVLCMACGTIRINPYLTDSNLQDFYTRFYQRMYGRSMDVEEYFRRQRCYGEKVLAASRRFLNAGSSVVEVGCGAGGALKAFQDCGYKAAGCDHSAELIEEGWRRGVQNIYPGSLKELPKETSGIKADLIYLHHVFEHLNDPLLFLKECKSLLAPHGKVVIVVPDVSRIHRYTNPAGDLLQFLHLAHKFNFSFDGLQRLSGRIGYSVVRLLPLPKMETPWSVMPELWAEMTPAEDKPTSTQIESTGADVGASVLRYLVRTEKLYKRGLCRSQLLLRLTKRKNRIQNKITQFRFGR